MLGLSSEERTLLFCRARTRRSEMKHVAVSLTDPHVSERCAHHGCCRKGSCRSAWLPLTKRLRQDQANGGVLNGIMQPIDSFAAIPKWQPPATAANGGQIIPCH